MDSLLLTLAKSSYELETKEDLQPPPAGGDCVMLAPVVQLSVYGRMMLLYRMPAYGRTASTH
jgi:hypothetical protein